MFIRQDFLITESHFQKSNQLSTRSQKLLGAGSLNKPVL